MIERQRRYVLLDRDGVISRRNSNGHANSWDQFEFLPRALEAMRLLAVNDYAGIVISRQTCAGDREKSSSELDVLTRRFLTEVALSEGHIAKVYYCRHGKEDQCTCYRPSVGLIERAREEHGFRLEETYFIGEREPDLRAAAAAGCPCIRIQRDAFLQCHAMCEEPHRAASSLYEAAERIVASGRVREPAYTAL